MNQPKLKMHPNPSPDTLAQRFFLVGNVDVDAVEILAKLHVLPPNCAIELNFADVERVNSMGLAQLLKLFELLQSRNNSIQIVQASRMIAVLFKMTGLGKYLVEGIQASGVVPSAHTSRMVTKNAAQRPTAPQVSDNAPKPTGGGVFGVGSLSIWPRPSASEIVQQFTLTGNIDVDASQALEMLYGLPPYAAITLDFSGVERVNSMGLAQLLKLFQFYRERHISISIINPNRMVGILFKMTGLNNFVIDGGEDNANNPSGNMPENPQIRPRSGSMGESQTLLLGEGRNKPTINTPAKPVGKLNLWVNAQSSQQMNGWYFFNTYLQRHLGREVQLELVHGAIADHQKKIEDFHVVFTKPFEAARLLARHEFVPVLRPIDQTDEVTLLVHANDPRQNLTEFQGGTVVTASQNNFVYLLGRFLLEESHADMADMEYQFTGHDIKALQTLLKGNADILLMLSDTYHGLSGLTKKMLRTIDQSETAFAFHLFAVSPEQADVAEALANVLLSMNKNSQGRKVLNDLGISGWIEPTADECDMLKLLLNRYATDGH